MKRLNNRLRLSEFMWGSADVRYGRKPLQFADQGNSRPRGGQARILTEDQLNDCLYHIRETSRTPESDELKLLLSHRAGLRAAEIAALPVEAFLNAEGRVSRMLVVEARHSKSKRSRNIPMHSQLREAFERFHRA